MPRRRGAQQSMGTQPVQPICRTMASDTAQRETECEITFRARWYGGTVVRFLRRALISPSSGAWRPLVACELRFPMLGGSVLPLRLCHTFVLACHRTTALTALSNLPAKPYSIDILLKRSGEPAKVTINSCRYADGAWRERTISKRMIGSAR